MDEKIVNQKVTVEDIVEQVIDMIHKGEFLPGMPLRETELCDRFGVSRTPVREALRLLQNNGVVEYIPRCGVQVVELTLDNLNYITDIRTVMESLSVQKAIEHITEHDIHVLREMNRKIGESTDTAEQSRLDEELHQYIAGKSGNPIIFKFLKELHVRQALVQCRIPFRPGRVVHSVQEHENIIQALEQKDGILAVKYTEIHFHMSQRSLQNKLKEYEKLQK